MGGKQINNDDLEALKKAVGKFLKYIVKGKRAHSIKVNPPFFSEDIDKYLKYGVNWEGEWCGEEAIIWEDLSVLRGQEIEAFLTTLFSKIHEKYELAATDKDFYGHLDLLQYDNGTDCPCAPYDV